VSASLATTTFNVHLSLTSHCGSMTLRYRAKFIERTVAHKAKIAGKFALFKTNNVLRVRVIAKPGGEDYDVWHNLVIDVNSVNLEELPPFHPNCRCDIVPEQVNE